MKPSTKSWTLKRHVILRRFFASAMLLSWSFLCFAVVGDAAQGADEADAAAAIKQLGGSLQKFGSNSDEWEVEFFVRGRQLTDDGLARVAALPNIVSLNLRDTQVTSAGLAHLKKMPKLRRLHLERTAIDDEGIEHLAQLADLEYLNLYDTSITDASLERISHMTKLKQLYVWKTRVTDKGVAKLEAALPKLTVVRGVDLSKLPDSFPKDKDRPQPTTMLQWIPTGNAKDAPKSTNGLNTQVFFENQSALRVKLYWVSFGGPLKLYAELEPGAKRQQNSYANHTWLITDDNDNALGYFVAVEDEALAIIPRFE